MGIVLAAESAPLLLLAGPSQGLVRRLGPRTTMLVADGVRVPLVAAVPLLHHAGGLSFGVLVALSFMAGAPWAAHSGSELVEREQHLTPGDGPRCPRSPPALLEHLSNLGGVERLTGLPGEPGPVEAPLDLCFCGSGRSPATVVR